MINLGHITDKKVILASASPRRKELLEKIGIDFEIKNSDIDENIIDITAPSEYACELAKMKALKVARDHTDALVIGADTIVVKDNKVLGKPEDRDDAVSMLKMLQGSVHEVITSLALVDLSIDYINVSCERTLVEIMPLTHEQIEMYVNTGEPMDKAGAYGIQGLGSVFIPRINGCYYNVVGLPLNRFWLALEDYKNTLTRPKLSHTSKSPFVKTD